MREYTQEEVQKMFLDHIRGVVRYWSMQNSPEKEKLEGVAFGILCLLDGVAGNMPAFEVIWSTSQSVDDKEYPPVGGVK